MTRLTEEQITQKARELTAAIPEYWTERGKERVLSGAWDDERLVVASRAAIIATLTEYAPHLLPRDADEELAEQWAENYLADHNSGQLREVMLRLIKHMRESGK